MENEGSNNNDDDDDDQVEEKEPPIRSVFSLKNKKRVREIEKAEDCFILDFNPYKKPLVLSSCLNQDQPFSNASVSVIAEYGKVASRDFPHSRHDCHNYPFNFTLHQKYCKLCYCYVCDIAAPCKKWSEHCNAFHLRYNPWWSLRRKNRGKDSDEDSEEDSD